jgi:hypothetical protein
VAGGALVIMGRVSCVSISSAASLIFTTGL